MGDSTCFRPERAERKIGNLCHLPNIDGILSGTGTCCSTDWHSLARSRRLGGLYRFAVWYCIFDHVIRTQSTYCSRVIGIVTAIQDLGAFPLFFDLVLLGDCSSFDHGEFREIEAMTPLHIFGDYLRDLLLLIPLSWARVLFVGTLLAIWIWILLLPKEQTQPEAGARRWDENLKIGASLALGFQVLIYLLL